MSDTTQSPSSDPLWYKDAIIYQLHVKAFCDSNDDGIGDFKGLISKLDYLQSLGVNTLWLLPFYPSPLRDDGYDIGNYRDINPMYGNMEDFRTFVEQVHERGMRVITELVINHTSDQHAWFQRARLAPAGSPERDYYVWSDTDQKYPETRIIFTDTETSNWAWDEVAGAYYWHRFFSHQPDLNFDNPAVLQEVIDVMYFWLDMGVDGLRLDAIPYLCVREGTNNENLPETHQILKKIRSALDARFNDRLLLAEANQWPEDTQDYFGQVNDKGYGDECHMAFHFPLMPRLYMALAQQDRHPIIDILHQTPPIPANCQWATFLRNHDELTLEMVTDKERAFMWDFYSSDKRARINVGIRRRLAPLMGNDRRKIELMNALLFSMPGTPIMYYGDEIGMGDNIYLKDRDGVRTPMQWTPERNGGFSKCDPAKLYMPAIMNPVYGFAGVNVEAQEGLEHSLLTWTKNLLNVVKQLPVFGRGNLTFLYPENRSVLAYIREFEGDVVLCLANVSTSSQYVELALQDYAGMVPVELLSGSAFAAITDSPYNVTLAPHGFFWLRLSAVGQSDIAVPQTRELATVILQKGITDINPTAVAVLETRALPAFMVLQRWFRGQGVLCTPHIEQIIPLNDTYAVMLVSVMPENSEPCYYTIPFGIEWETTQTELKERPQASIIARIRQVNHVGVLYEASKDDEFLRLFMRGNHSVTFEGDSADVDIDNASLKPLGVEQTNSSVLVGDRYIFKLLRQPCMGVNLEKEYSDFFQRVSFTHSPEVLGTWKAANGMVIALLQRAVANSGDAWAMTLEHLANLGKGSAPKTGYESVAMQLGECTAMLHKALSTPANIADFEPEPCTASYRMILITQAVASANHTFEELERMIAVLPEDIQASAHALLEKRNAIIESLTLPDSISDPVIRVHGDYHLGQVLVGDQEFTIIDFEGEPSRSIQERRRKTLALKDVAGMIRSFDYARATALQRSSTISDPSLQQLLESWLEHTVSAFLKGYGEHNGAILYFFLMEKALYEVVYELEHRPDWVAIPLQGVLTLLHEKGKYL